jgi:prepilin-type N-terminal cleavage/methylation domain-containing protein
MGQTESRSGFTFIEVLIVLMLLAIVSATFIPQITAANSDARRTAVEEDLALMRRQIQNFKDQHNQFPAYGSDSQVQFLEHLMQKTNRAGQVLANGRFGPYLLGDVPENPFTRSNAVLVVLGDLKAHQYSGHGSHGWAYSSTTGEIRVNLSPNVVDPNGEPVNRQ